MKMQTFRKPHQWLNFWLEKYADVLSGLKYNGEQRKQFWSTLKVFLEELPGNPRNIPIASVQSFIAADPAERLLPITLFYQHIASSKTHLEMLKKLESTAGSHSSDEHGDLVQQFRAVLSCQKFSQNTMKNYCTVVAAYLKWLAGLQADMSIVKIDEYSLYLTNERQLAPRTVALHAAALKLFYHKVIDPASSDSPA